MEKISWLLDAKLNHTMTIIQSKIVDITAHHEECYSFLTNMNNYHLLLPKDNISDWVSDDLMCSFKIQKMYKLELVYSAGHPFSKIHIKSGSSSPFSFDLFAHLEERNHETSAQLICEADINPFLKLMVEKPLNNLFNYMAERLSKVHQK
jgi:hypothetical protein